MIKGIYFDKLEPILLCGKPILYGADLYAYEPPFEIEPTTGKHDFNTCEDCKDYLKKIENSHSEQFNGSKGQSGFPFCCSSHANLVKIKEFDKQHFIEAPMMVAKKVIYTKQHLLNNHNSVNWYKEITDYIVWAIESFGTMPKECGEPLYLSSYLSMVNSVISDFHEITFDKKLILTNFIQSFSNPKSLKTDFNILMRTIDEWFKVFPFELETYFGDITARLKVNIPIFHEERIANIYSGKKQLGIYPKYKLLENMANATCALLNEVNGAQLYEKGLISDTTKIHIDLLNHERKIKKYDNKSPNQDNRYRRVIKEWLKDEKQYMIELATLLQKDKTKDVLIQKQETQKREINSNELEAYFSPIFKGKGNGSVNYFDALISELQTNRTAKEFAQIALMIYEGGKMNSRRPQSFRKWHKSFCECIACKYVQYDPKDLRKPNANLKTLFNYLQ